MEALNNIKKVIGIKQSIRAIEKGLAEKVYIASDADSRLISPLQQLCAEKNIPVQLVETMKALGESCGIDVGAAAVTQIRAEG